MHIGEYFTTNKTEEDNKICMADKTVEINKQKLVSRILSKIFKCNQSPKVKRENMKLLAFQRK